MARFYTVNDIINRAAVEAGLLPDPSPVLSTNESFVQLSALLNSCGQEMVDLHPWQGLIKEFEISTSGADTGLYPLPDDFGYMIDQTGWERTNTRPLGGPLSPQDWTYLKGRGLVTQTLWANFRLVENEFAIYPNDPVMGGLEISFEYVNINWIRSGGQSLDQFQAGGDTVLFPPIMMIKFLKSKYLEANGFDSSSARMEFDNMFLSLTSKDAGAKLLNAGSASRGEYYLNAYKNVNNTGYGS
jgi:hypothetical protein